MKTTEKKLLVLALFSVAISTQLYSKTQPEKPLFHRTEKENIFVFVEKLAPKKSKHATLNNKRLFKKYRPIKLTIINDSNNTLELNGESTDRKIRRRNPLSSDMGIGDV